MERNQDKQSKQWLSAAIPENGMIGVRQIKEGITLESKKLPGKRLVINNVAVNAAVAVIYQSRLSVILLALALAIVWALWVGPIKFLAGGLAFFTLLVTMDVLGGAIFSQNLHRPGVPDFRCGWHPGVCFVKRPFLVTVRAVFCSLTWNARWFRGNAVKLSCSW